MRKYIKIILAILILVFLAAGCESLVGTPRDGTTTDTYQKAEEQLRQSQEQIQNRTVEQPQTGKLSVIQSVQRSNFNQPGPYEVEEGKTALELLKSTHEVKTKEYSGVGEFVTSIDGIEPKSNEFWAFYANGQQAVVGAGSYELKNNDKIEWKLEKIEAYK